MVSLESILLGRDPVAALSAMRENGELLAMLPEVDALFGVPQPAQHHPEIDSGIHTLMVLERAVALTGAMAAKRTFRIRLAALLHDVGKALTPAHRLPSHPGHEKAGVEPARAACDRLGVAAETKAFALMVTEYHMHTHKAFEMRGSRVARLLREDLGALQDPEAFEDFLIACTADATGRLGKENAAYPEANYLRLASEALRSVSTSETDNALAHASAKAVAKVKEHLSTYS